MDPPVLDPFVEILLAEKSNSNEQEEEEGDTSGWDEMGLLLTAVESMKCIGLAGAL